jgi:hypothetical protein
MPRGTVGERGDMKIPILSRIAGLPRRTRWIVISAIVLCGVELVLALVLSASWVKDAPRLLAFADKVKYFAPVVGNFDQVVRHPEGVRVFFSITICLLPLKIFLFYLYMYINETKISLSFWIKLLIVVAAIGLLLGTLALSNSSRAGFRGINEFISSGIKYEGVLLWISWSIFELGCTSFFVSTTLLILWKECVSLFHNLKGRKNE